VTLADLVRQLVEVSPIVPLMFSVHPRTRKRLEEYELIGALTAAKSIHLTEPLGYIQFMNLVSGSRVVITDSGGVQEETSYLGVPCLTLRENTERPMTVTHGTNQLVQPAELLATVQRLPAMTTISRPSLDVGTDALQAVASRLWHGGQQVKE
jgi:UDP-N-acetylglucosamine 2-epimerase (non-hydrolysing)